MKKSTAPSRARGGGHSEPIAVADDFDEMSASSEEIDEDEYHEVGEEESSSSGPTEEELLLLKDDSFLYEDDGMLKVDKSIPDGPDFSTSTTRLRRGK